jgi:molecular chaperone HtpG
MPTSPVKPTPPKGSPVPEPLFGSFLLESITTGMYGEQRNAIREYVQNGFDGVQDAIAGKVLKPGKGKITLTIDGTNNLTIYDNGIGLPHRVAVSTLTAVGASRKERGRQAGFRGIGRLAGIAFSNRLQFRTKAAGDAVETIVLFDCVALRKGMLSSGMKPAAELIRNCVTWRQESVERTSDHYFEVMLQELNSAPAEATDPVQLEDFLTQVAPVDFHPDFEKFKNKILGDAAAIQVPMPNDGKPDDDAGTESILQRVAFDHVAIVILGSESKTERQVFKPYRPKMAAGGKESVSLTEVKVHSAVSGVWWGWIGYKRNPGDYEQASVAGIRFRLKNIQIDGNELIRNVPITNDIRSTFGRWSNWFVGEIYVDPHGVVPNARRDNFEEDERWLEIRREITVICETLTKEAREVSKEHQVSLEVLGRKVDKSRNEYLKISRAKTFDVAKARKLIVDTEKVQKDIEKAGAGAASTVQLSLKTFSKELNQIRVGLLEQPKTPEYEQFRKAIRQEMLETTLNVLKNYLDLQLFDEVKTALQKALK